ncbi:MAG: hypothetical protein U5R14_11420 [Gemmatimonadota bacterium]|nr:hypothetical protein [Gemmatimonadota bacterium]
MTLYATVVTLLAGATVLAYALAVGLGSTLFVPRTRAGVVSGLADRASHPIGWAWGVALVATLGEPVPL